MTFSVAGHCPRTGMFGAAVSTSSLAVGSRCAWVRAGVGVALIQNYADPALGPQALQMLADGMDAAPTLDRLVEAAGPGRAWRQIMVLDSQGRTASHDGECCFEINGCVAAPHCIAGGNHLASAHVAPAIAAAFDAADSELHLGERLLLALEAGLAAGGEANPVRSAHLLVADRLAWPLIDLRVDLHERPIEELRRVWDAFAPQAAGFVARALDPAGAPMHPGLRGADPKPPGNDPRLG